MLPRYFASHVIALVGVLAIHLSIAAYAFASFTGEESLIPVQQVIKVSMVAPTTISSRTTKVIHQREIKNSKILPQDKGMVKATNKNHEKSDVYDKELNNKLTSSSNVTQLSSGQVSEEAEELDSALTEPTPAGYLQNKPPKYPNSARSRRQQGIVLLDVTVSNTGKARYVTIHKSSGYNLLDSAALNAVKKWEFVPAKKGNSIIEANVIVPVEFKIKS